MKTFSLILMAFGCALVGPGMGAASPGSEAQLAPPAAAKLASGSEHDNHHSINPAKGESAQRRGLSSAKNEKPPSAIKHPTAASLNNQIRSKSHAKLDGPLSVERGAPPRMPGPVQSGAARSVTPIRKLSTQGIATMRPVATPRPISQLPTAARRGVNTAAIDGAHAFRSTTGAIDGTAVHRKP